MAKRIFQKSSSEDFFICVTPSESDPQSELKIVRKHCLDVVELRLGGAESEAKVEALSKCLAGLNAVVVMTSCWNIPAVFDVGIKASHDGGVFQIRGDGFVKSELTRRMP